ncbi:MAG: hypothetical protein IPI68_08340 [Chitinophagaceae bacterium]|nr:hypothetical protein [Chitinophagaceae bacterium]
MEVHAHTHTPRKKWTHYLWEFLMLFLAVFCGFLAENQREHFVENKREKQFMKTLLHDLGNDTANFTRTINTFQSTIDRFDSLKYSIKNPLTPENILNTYKAATLLQNFSSFNYSDRTIEQLRSAGNFRLIRKPLVSDTLLEYDRYIRHTYLPLENILEQQDIKLMDMQNEIFDYDTYNFLLAKSWHARQTITADSILLSFKLFSKDEHMQSQYYNSFGVYRNWCQRIVSHSKYAKGNATRLIELVKKEYHLQ